MTVENIDVMLRTAIHHHRSGNLAEAEKLYRAILAANPNHPQALHHLGIVAVQCGKPQLAVDLIGRSIAIEPSAAAFNNLGEAFRTLGRSGEAIDCYHRAIALDPRQVGALSNLGLALTAAKKLPEAERVLRQALSIAPNHVAALTALAQMLDKSDRADDAVSAWERAAKVAPMCPAPYRALGAAWLRAGDPYRGITAIRRAIELRPNEAESYSKLAIALDAVNKSDDAIAAARKAVEIAPMSWQAHFGLASALQNARRFEESIQSFDDAIKLNSLELALHGSLSAVLMSLGRVDEAADALVQGAAINPNSAKLHSVLSVVRFAQRNYESAVKSARLAVSLDAHSVEAHASLAFGLLAAGRFAEGFREYEWRWRDATFTTKPRDFDRPLWDGSDPSGRRILVHCEQGFGDNFQFLRYLPMLRAQGALVIIEVSYKIAGLIRRMPAEMNVIVAGTMLPDFDMHVPLMSLPAIFGTTLANIPSAVPYFTADPTRIAQWRLRLEPTGGLQVGLVWGGNSKPDPKRSIKLTEFAPLGAVPGVCFISLQSPPQSAEAESPPGGLKLANLGPELRDFSDTTAPLLANLDLLITIDTGVAHLAAAMGVPTWILLPYSCDWRWVHHESLSPWYPTVRLYRQTSRDDWTPVMERVAADLCAMSASNKNFTC
jgi:tetratricopeptide (TPR) repeat protein